MGLVEVDFPVEGFSLDALQRAAYRFTNRFSCEFVEVDAVHRCVLRAESDIEASVIEDFRTEALDQVLRERIRAETAAVRNTILAVAFSNTGLISE